MNLKNYYYYYQSALSPKLCDDIINHGKNRQLTTAIVGEYEKILKKNGKLNKKNIKNIQKIRKSEVVWMDDGWIYKEIQPYVHDANKSAGWNFDWDWSETCQFTKYSVGQYYDWHCDVSEEPVNRPQNADGTWPPDHGKIRKLSVTVSLSDPKDYKGGELEFDYRNQNSGKKSIHKCKEILPRGSIIVFPSHVWHRVTPVTKGTRYSLVMWNLGYPFK